VENARGNEVVKKILECVWDLIPEETHEGASDRYSALLSSLVSYIRFATGTNDKAILTSMCEDIKNELLERVGENVSQNKS